MNVTLLKNDKNTSALPPEIYQNKLEAKYNTLLNELDVYQRKVVEAPVQESMSCIAGAGCLSGDTPVRVFYNGIHHCVTLKQAFEKFNRILEAGKPDILTEIKSFIQPPAEYDLLGKRKVFKGILKKQKIIGIYYSGVKEIFRITLENNWFVDVTEGHGVLTKTGFIPAKDLTSKDEVMIDVLKSPRHIEYSKFKSRVSLGEQDTYDLECEKEQNFVANGIVVKNSGKTRTIISRAIKMVVKDNVPPEEIVLITFTNKAANELKERYINFFEEFAPSKDRVRTPHISTIHSFCLSQIRRTFGFERTILSEYNSFKLFKEIAKDIVLNEEGTPVESSVYGTLYKRYQSFQSSMDIVYSMLPLFDIYGNFVKVLPYTSAKTEHPDVSLLKKLSYLYLQRKAQGLATPDLTPPEFNSMMTNYLIGTGIKKQTFLKICATFLIEKYKNNCLDFTDMDFQYIMLLAQFPELRNRVHDKYVHFFFDEMQDCTASQFLVGVLSDKETFEDFIE